MFVQSPLKQSCFLVVQKTIPWKIDTCHISTFPNKCYRVLNHSAYLSSISSMLKRIYLPFIQTIVVPLQILILFMNLLGLLFRVEMLFCEFCCYVGNISWNQLIFAYIKPLKSRTIIGFNFYTNDLFCKKGTLFSVILCVTTNALRLLD